MNLLATLCTDIQLICSLQVGTQKTLGCTPHMVAAPEGQAEVVAAGCLVVGLVDNQFRHPAKVHVVAGTYWVIAQLQHQTQQGIIGVQIAALKLMQPNLS